MAGGLSSERANKIFITLKSELPILKDPVAIANAGKIEVNTNTGITWMQLLLNLEIPLSGGYVIKNDSEDIVSQLTDTVHSYVTKFKKIPANRNFSVKIMTKSVQEPPTKVPTPAKGATHKNDSPKKGGKAVGVATRGRGRPPKNSSLGLKKPVFKAKSPSKTSVNNKRNGNVMEIDLTEVPNVDIGRPNMSNNSSANNSKSNDSINTRSSDGDVSGRINIINFDISNGRGSNEGPNDILNTPEGENVADGIQQDRDDMDSLFSQRTQRQSMASAAGRPGTSADAKAAVLESMIKNVTNTMLWRIKDEYDELQRKGKWLRLSSTYIPQLGNLIADMFHDKHFKR